MEVSKKSGSNSVETAVDRTKRPASAFFVFMDEFRKEFKEKNPNIKSVSVVGKAGGAKWKSMSDAEKAPYVSKADKRKKDYEKNMDSYNNKLAQGTNASEDKNEESDKSWSEASDEDDEGSECSDEDDEGSECSGEKSGIAMEVSKKSVRNSVETADPNKPKRDVFRKEFKEKNPNIKSVSVVGKAGGAKWKSMSAAEKAPYVSKADKRKKDYEKNLDAYNKKLAQGTNASEDKNEESDKSRSEANDEGLEGSGEVEDSGHFGWILYDWRTLLVFGGFVSLALVTAF